MVKIIVHGKPISVNGAYTGRRGGKKVLNNKARAYREQCWIALNKQKTQIEQLRASFDPTKFGIAISIMSYVPVKDYFLKSTQSNGLSQAKGDLDNGLKLLVDFLMNSRYADRLAPVIGIDDKYIIDVQLIQRPIQGSKYITNIQVDKIPLPIIIPKISDIEMY